MLLDANEWDVREVWSIACEGISNRGGLVVFVLACSRRCWAGEEARGCQCLNANRRTRGFGMVGWLGYELLLGMIR